MIHDKTKYGAKTSWFHGYGFGMINKRGMGDDYTLPELTAAQSTVDTSTVPSMTPGTDLSSFVPTTGIPGATTITNNPGSSTGSTSNWLTSMLSSASSVVSSIAPQLQKLGVTIPGQIQQTAPAMSPIVPIVLGGGLLLLFLRKKKSAR
jgi:hypothetical protein